MTKTSPEAQHTVHIRSRCSLRRWVSFTALLSIFLSTCVLSTGASAAACSLCLYGPDNLAFDRIGNILLTDNDHKKLFRVLKLSKTGAKLQEWRGFNKVEGRQSGPEGLAIAANGNVLVTDGGSLRIIVLSSDLKFLYAIGGKAGTFHDLGHVAIDASGFVYVSEGLQNRLQQFTLGGKRIAAWQMRRGSAADEMNMPQSIGIAPNGHLVVEDWRNRRIVVMSPPGKSAFSFGHSGAAIGEFENTSGLYVNGSGEILVAEESLHRVQRFDPEGKWISSIGNTPDRSLFTEGPSSIASDADGVMYAADGRSIVKWLPDGHIVARWH